MKRGEVFVGVVTEKHTIRNLRTGRVRHALVVNRGGGRNSEDWIFVPPDLWRRAQTEAFDGDCHVEYGIGRQTRIVTRPVLPSVPYIVEPLALGFFCRACSVWNGDQKEVRTTCRACETERPRQ